MDENTIETNVFIGGGWAKSTARGVHIYLPEFEKIWPVTFAKMEERSSRRDPRGAKGDPRWEEILIEAARYMYQRQDAGLLEDLINHLKRWLNDPEDKPSRTAMKEHLSPLWRSFKDVDG